MQIEPANMNYINGLAEMRLKLEAKGFQATNNNDNSSNTSSNNNKRTTKNADNNRKNVSNNDDDDDDNNVDSTVSSPSTTPSTTTMSDEDLQQRFTEISTSLGPKIAKLRQTQQLQFYGLFKQVKK